MKHTLPARTMIAAAALMIAGSSFAATLTAPADRDAKALHTSIKAEMGTMLPSKGNAPKEKDAKPAKKIIILKGLSGFGGTQVYDATQLSRFLELGMTQSHNKTWEQGWTIVRDNIQSALNGFPTLPEGVRMALQSGLDNAYDKSWQAGYEVMYTTMRTVANNPAEFANPNTAFGAYLRLARQSAYEKSWEHGWKIVNKFLVNLKDRGQGMIPTQELRIALNATIATAYDVTWQAGYEAMHVGVKHMEVTPMGPLASFYFRQGIEASYEKSWEHGWKILGHYIDHAVKSGLLQPFEKLTLETSRKGSYGTTWQAGYEVMRDGLKAVMK